MLKTKKNNDCLWFLANASAEVSHAAAKRKQPQQKRQIDHNQTMHELTLLLLLLLLLVMLQQRIGDIWHMTYWHMTHDIWHVEHTRVWTHDAWHMTHDTWRMTHDMTYWHIEHTRVRAHVHNCARMSHVDTGTFKKNHMDSNAEKRRDRITS